MVRGHAAAYHTIHKIQPSAQVGFALHYRRFLPKIKWSPLDKLMKWVADSFINRLFLEALVTGRMNLFGGFTRIPEAKGTQDFIGLNYYTTSLTGFNVSARDSYFLKESYPEGAVLSETGFIANVPVSSTHLRAHETPEHLVCRLLLEKKQKYPT